MKFEPRGNLNISIVLAFWILVMLGAISIGYGFYYLHSPHPETSPKTIHEGVIIVIPNYPYVAEVNITASTSDVFASFNTFNLTMHIQFNDSQDISKAYILLIPTSFNTSVFTSTGVIQKLVAFSLSVGNGFNLTSVIREYTPSSLNASPVRATADFSLSDDGEYTFLVLVLPNHGVFEIGKTNQTLLNVLPYSSYLEAESVREIAQSTITQIWLSYLMLGFTLIVSSFTLSQVVDVKRKPRGSTIMAALLIVLIVLAVAWFAFVS